jgi:iron complex outermembrane receptor protein
MKKTKIVAAIMAMAAGGGFAAPAAAQDQAANGAPADAAPPAAPEAPAPTPAMTVQTPAAPAPTGDNEQSATGLETVVVTARRTAENGQTVPVAVSAFSAADLQREQITTGQDLQGRVPSLSIGSNSQLRNTETPTIRGQGGTYGASPGVVVYMAEVPVPEDAVTNGQGGPGKFFDLANLQILKGSQGTLFGRNTTGGALLVEPHKPDARYEFALHDTGTNYSGETVESVLNLPLVGDSLLMRLGAQYVTRGGFTHDVVTGEDYDNKRYWTARLGLTWRPADGIENYLLAYYTYSKDNGSGYVIEGVNQDGINYGLLALISKQVPGNPFNTLPYSVALPIANLAGLGCAYINLEAPSTKCGQDIVAAQQARGIRNVSQSGPPDDNIVTGAVTDQFRWEINDQLALRDIASYSALKHQFRWDLSGSRANFDTENNPNANNSADGGQFTEELQAQGSVFDERLKYTIGGYYQYDHPLGEQQEDPIALFMTLAPEIYGLTQRSYAPYAQGSYDLGGLLDALDGFKITVGVRDTHDHIEGFSNAGTGYHTGNFSKSVLTYTAGLDKQIDATLLYGKISRGYKAGGFEPVAVNPADYTFKPEYVENYEVGEKSDFRVGGLPARLNASLYYTSYTDMQRAAEDSLSKELDLFGFGAAIITAGKAEIAGAELEGTLEPLPGFTTALNYSLTYGKYDQFTLVNNATNPLYDCTDQYILSGGTAQLQCVPFQATPKHQGSFTARYVLPGEVAGGRIDGSVTYAFTDRQYASSYQRPEAEPGAWLGSFGLLNANLDWSWLINDKNAVDLRFFGTNLTDRTYRISNSNVWNTIYFRSSLYGEPRIFGIQLGFGWGE